ncbi:uncharacterized protein [Malus domestica]|uniref:uncharacterized protein isoform X1 n=1 Tax=Malus domestica TaxID=3750 RepID=UPI0010AAC13B|nr:uncharacterized protein LOC103420748 [Malus domestica]
MLTNQQAQFQVTLQNQQPDLRRTMLEEIRQIRAELRPSSTERTSSIPTFGSTPSTSSLSATPAPSLFLRVHSGSAPQLSQAQKLLQFHSSAHTYKQKHKLLHLRFTYSIPDITRRSLKGPGTRGIAFQSSRNTRPPSLCLSSSSSFFFQWQSWTIHGAHVVEPFAAIGLVQFE